MDQIHAPGLSAFLPSLALNLRSHAFIEGDIPRVTGALVSTVFGGNCPLSALLVCLTTTLSYRDIVMADPLARSVGGEEEEEIAELIKGVKRHGGELSLAYRPFNYIPGVRTLPSLLLSLRTTAFSTAAVVAETYRERAAADHSVLLVASPGCNRYPQCHGE